MISFFKKVYRIAKKMIFILNYDPAIPHIEKAVRKTKTCDKVILKKRLKKTLSLAKIIRNRKMKDSGFFMKCYLFLFFGFFIRYAIWNIDDIYKDKSTEIFSKNQISDFPNDRRDSSFNFDTRSSHDLIDMPHSNDSYTNSATSLPSIGSIDISGNLNGTTSSSSFDDYRD